MSGWIKLHRKITDNAMWTCEKFSRGQAWVDLLLLANHDYGFFYIRDIKVEVQRGQVAWSEPRLASRWHWSRTKVRKFLNDLEKEQQLIQQKSNVTQVLTIVNYESYQEKEQQEDSRKTAGRQQEDPNKNNKEETKNNKEKNILSETIDRIYAVYPTKCPIKGRSTGKSYKHKNRIEKELKRSTEEELINVIDVYVADCIRTQTSIKNFSTFLNNIPDIEDSKPKPTPIPDFIRKFREADEIAQQEQKILNQPLPSH